MVQPSDDAFTPSAIRAQLGSAYDRFDAEQQSRHSDMLRSIRRPQDVEVAVESTGNGRYTVTLCATEIFGVLSIIAGMFTAHRHEILNVDAFTLEFAGPRQTSKRRARRYRPFRPAAGRDMILDVFEVRVSDDADTDTVWSLFRNDLTSAFDHVVREGPESALELLIDRVSEAVGYAGDDAPQLLPETIDLSNDESPSYTRMRIRGIDTPGFLFAFSNTLAMLEFNIHMAQIRTDRGRVDDTFWLTGRRGEKIVNEDRLHELRAAAALMKHFTFLLPRSSNPSQALHQFNALTRQMLSRPDWTGRLRDLESPDVLELLAEMMGVSQFLWEDFLRMQHENLFPVVLDTPALDEDRSIDRLRKACDEQTQDGAQGGGPVSALNEFKDREMFRIDLRHITHRIDFRRFSEELTELAEVVVQKAAELVQTRLDPRFGSPTLEDESHCGWCICALGKFGGRELGFGSDVELLFIYEAEGATDGTKSIENSRYFAEFVHEFTRTVVTRKESIFEIDLRLRPYGNAGPMATSLEAFRRYYTEGGPARQFERMALVKLRPVAGDPELGAQASRLRDGFVYSPVPLDMDDVLHLRRRQADELVHSGAVNAKYSPGGLVDLEYFVQAQQIAAGLLSPEVRVTNTLDAIDSLTEGGHIPSDRAGEVSQTYEFMRLLIDALRVVRGHAKDLTIPDPDSRELTYLAQRLQFASVRELSEAIATRMSVASSLLGDSGSTPR